jgi:hypothetical protein
LRAISAATAKDSSSAKREALRSAVSRVIVWIRLQDALQHPIECAGLSGKVERGGVDDIAHGGDATRSAARKASENVHVRLQKRDGHTVTLLNRWF